VLNYDAVWWMSLSAIIDEQIRAAVAYHNNRPPLDAIRGPAELVSFAVKLIPLCWLMRVLMKDQRLMVSIINCRHINQNYYLLS